ncbi:hypothetical protein, conserved [Leishmania donovani]|uniref:AAA+ ATPase domain-containing protein n=1 Tax=Leishmania donovani TaxID=5661 RepID=E9BH92_LEIDO|nr:hypothetical protein, conserved [Leishmania donovani]TPP52350.1 hypothetical protein CGC21_16725 [Leishmania donovani]CBZ34618.1 hypothetical protein, conserved [Leishmania donovani]
MHVFTRILAVFVIVLAALLIPQFLEPIYVIPAADAVAQFCSEPPLCARKDRTMKQQLLCTIRSAPLKPASPVYRQYVVSRLKRYVDGSIRSQSVAPSVIERVRYKLAHMHEPMILHFAGDNGVGKTRLAELISLAIGQKCGDATCSIGDTTLVLSGTSYDGMTVAEFRNAVVPVVVRHAQRYPDNGVVIFNELTSLEPSKVRVLSPLLGRGTSFPENPGVSIAPLLVILTTDFGREGRTRGKSLFEMRAFITDEFADLYSKEAASHVRTFPFLPISLSTAGDIVRVVVREIGCSAPQPLCLAISDSAVVWLVERTKILLPAENGRAVAFETKLQLEALLEQVMDNCTHESGIIATDELYLDVDATCPYRRCTVFLEGDGTLAMTCQGTGTHSRVPPG